MKTVFLNIGTNLGQRRINLSRAVSALEKEFGYFELSHAVESLPEGFESPNKFLNIGIMVTTDLAPEEVLEKIREIERSISPASHRKADGSYADRVIDIDIIAIDNMVIDTPELQVPHPRMSERRFVLEPLAELAPFWVHPVLHASPGELLSRLDNKSE